MPKEMNSSFLLISILLIFFMTMPVRAAENQPSRTDGGIPEKTGEEKTAVAPAEPAPQRTPDLVWYPPKQGLLRARAENKKVFLNFFAPWCAYCGKMEQTTFSDSRVVEFMKEHFIPIKVNVEENQALARQYFVRGLPSSWFLTARGEKISNLPGYVDAEMLLSMLQYIASDRYLDTTFKAFLDTL